MDKYTSNNTVLRGVTLDNSSAQNITHILALDDEADDAIWILTSTFIIFTMQSGK